METYSLSIDAVRGRLDMQGQNLLLSTSMPQAVMDITKQRGGLQVQTRHPQVTVDASQALSEENRATTEELTDRFAQEGMQTVQAACVRYNQWGQVYRSLPRNHNAIRNSALSSVLPGLQMPQLTFIPSAPLQIEVTDNVLSLDYVPDDVQVNFETHQQADISVEQPAQLSIWVADDPSLHFSITA